MSTVPESLPVADSIPASRGLHWAVDGLRLWRCAPFKLFFLCLAVYVVELALQLAIPWVGVTLSKLMVPMLQMGILLGLGELASGGKMRWASLLGGFLRRRFLPTLGLAVIWGLGVFAIQQGVAWMVYGWPAVDAVLLGHGMTHREMITLTFQRVLLIPGVVPSTLLLLAPCLFLFDDRPPWHAACESVRTVFRHPAPFAVFLLGNLALFFLMMMTSWTLVLVLLIMPWALSCTYVVWKDTRRVATEN